MSGIYYYLKRGEEIFGPAIARQLIAAAEKGIVEPTDELSASRDGPWYSAASCVELWEHQHQESDDEEECLIVWEGSQRHGPFSKRQLRSLLENDQLPRHAYVADTAGRLTQLALFLGMAEEPRASAPPPPEPFEPPPTSNTKSSSSREARRTPRRTKKKRKKQPQRKSPAESQTDALYELLNRELTSPPPAPDRDKLPPPMTRSKKKEQVTAPPTHTRDDSASGDPLELTFIKTIRSRVRSQAFQQAYLLASILAAVQGAIYLVAVGAVTTSFLARISSLAIEVFVPFGASSEQLQETDLAYAGIASVLLCAELLCPVFFLLKGDTDFRLWAIATVVGVIAGMAIAPDSLTKVGVVAKWGIAVCGFGIAASGLRIAWMTPAQMRWRFLGLAASAITAGGATALVFAITDELVEIQMASLPPSLQGESIAALMPAGISLLAVWLPVPLYCFNILSSQADESTRTYMTYCVWGAGVLSVFGLFCLIFLGNGSQLRYLSIPLALLPMTVGAVICAMMPAVMWTLQPAYTAR